MFDEHAQEGELNRILASRFGITLESLEESVRDVQVGYRLIGFRKKERSMLAAIRRLEATKRALVSQIDEIRTLSGKWGRIQRKLNRGGPWRRDERYEYIRREFNLNDSFERIDKETKRALRLFRVIKGNSLPSEENRKRIEPHTLIVLVWMMALKPHCARLAELYRTTYELIIWFTTNRENMLDRMASKLSEVDESSIRKDYERYIQSPTEQREAYRDWAEMIHADNF